MQQHAIEQIIGVSHTHIADYVCPYSATKIPVHHQILQPLQDLVILAQKDGVYIQLISGFRSFERQLTIWNSKWAGQREVRDAYSQIIDPLTVDETQRLWLLLTWSAVPGLSRHHWGTDIDIFDAKAISQGHKVTLVPEEFSKKGPCNKLGDWLNNNLLNTSFFRPYWPHSGKISPEPWHISFKPLAQGLESAALKHSPNICQHIISQKTAGHSVIKQNFSKILNEYFKV
ncbi:MAG: M15 family metallopeptidase [Pseudomonadota bacterium]